MAKNADLRIRLEEDDLERVKRMASAHHLAVATLVRQTVLNVVEAWERAREAEK